VEVKRFNCKSPFDEGDLADQQKIAGRFVGGWQ
jgi:hypothetical protein